METQWSIDRSKKVEETIPDVVSQMVVEEILKNVGGSDWNEPLEVSKTIGNMMSINVSKEIETQCPKTCNIGLTVLTHNKDDKNMPFWICQSIIRVDEKYGNRYIEHEGAKYNKIDIMFTSKYFSEQLDKVAEYADCTWNIRWGAAKNPENKLHKKTRPGESESWLDKNIGHLLTEQDTDGINIKNLVMLEFKRKVE